MRKTVLTAGLLLLLGVAPVSAREKPLALNKIVALVETVQPKKGRKYAERVARIIYLSARSQHLPPEIVATTAYIESEFKMAPHGGMMQITKGTYNYRHRKTGLKLEVLEQNVRIGARELKYCQLASRKGRLSEMWGAYNGCGRSGKYVRKSLRVLKQIQYGNPEEWDYQIKHRGALWK